jgi:hypothetical protein
MSNLQSVSKLTNKTFSQCLLGLLVLSVVGVAIAYFSFTAPASAQGACLGTAQTGIVCGVIASAPEESSPLVFVNGVDAQETTYSSQPSEGSSNVYAGALQVLGLIVGVPMLLFGFVQMAAGSEGAIKRVMFGGAALGAGVVAPAMMSMFV